MLVSSMASGRGSNRPSAGGSSAGSGRRCRRPGGWRARCRLPGGRSRSRDPGRSRHLCPGARHRAPSPRRRPCSRSYLRKSGTPVQLLGDGDLQMMAGNAFVIGDGLDLVEVAVGGVVGVDEQTAGAAAVGRARLVVGGRRGLRHVIGNRDHFKAAPWAGGRRAAAAWPAWASR